MNSFYLLAIYTFLSTSKLFAGESAYFDNHSFEEALGDYQNIQKEIDSILKARVPACISLIGNTESSIDRCSVMDYCKVFKDNIDSPNLYKDKDGIIPNPMYYNDQAVLVSCLKDHYQDDIKDLITEFKKNSESKHLKEVYDLNTALTKQLKTAGEASKYALVNQELINLRLKAAMNPDAEEIDLAELIKTAQTNTKTALSKKTIELILKIDQKVNDKSYMAESEKFETNMFPAMKSDSKFANLKNFTEVAFAGNQKALEQNQNLFNQKAQDVYGIFSEVKADYIEYLKSKRGLFNKDEIDRAIQRVGLIKFKTPVLSKELMAACEMPNAWYQADSNSVTVCPGWFDRPKMFLYETFAHELSHSIDSCSLSAPMRIKSTKADIVEDGPFEVKLTMDKLNQSEVKIFEIDSSGMKPTDQKLMSLKNNPFNKVLSCLKDDKSIGADVPDRNQIKLSIDNAIEGLRKIGRSNLQDTYFQYLSFAKNNLDQFMSYYGECNMPHQNGLSQVEEAFADKMASELVAKKIEKMPKAKAKEEMAKLVLGDLNSDNLICPRGNVQKTIKAKGEEIGCESYFANKTNAMKMADALKMSSEYNKDSHPPMSARYDKIIFAHPKIRAALDCKKDGGKYCED